MSARVTLSCTQCGTKFSLMPSAAKSKLERNNGNIFCNLKCFGNYQRVEPVELTCDFCGTKFVVPHDEATRRLKQAHVYCTCKCYSDSKRKRI